MTKKRKKFKNRIDKLNMLSEPQKVKVEFLCNECCFFGCKDRKQCYEAVSRKNLGENCPDYHCTAPDANHGYSFSKAMTNPGFIGIEDIKNVSGIGDSKFEKIKEYIANQYKEDKLNDQMSMFEKIDPFKK